MVCVGGRLFPNLVRCGTGIRYFGVGEEEFQVDDRLAGEHASCYGVNLAAAMAFGEGGFAQNGPVIQGTRYFGVGNRSSRLMIGWPGSMLLAMG